MAICDISPSIQSVQTTFYYIRRVRTQPQVIEGKHGWKVYSWVVELVYELFSLSLSFFQVAGYAISASGTKLL